MFAVLRTGGKQYKVSKDETLRGEKLEGQAGDKITLDDIVMTSDGKAPKFGAGKVMAEIIDHVRGPKIVIFKKKRRQNYRRKKGHRQDLTEIKITDISA